MVHVGACDLRAFEDTWDASSRLALDHPAGKGLALVDTAAPIDEALRTRACGGNHTRTCGIMWVCSGVYHLAFFVVRAEIFEEIRLHLRSLLCESRHLQFLFAQRAVPFPLIEAAL